MADTAITAEHPAWKRSGIVVIVATPRLPSRFERRLDVGREHHLVALQRAHRDLVLLQQRTAETAAAVATEVTAKVAGKISILYNIHRRYYKNIQQMFFLPKISPLDAVPHDVYAIDAMWHGV